MYRTIGALRVVLLKESIAILSAVMCVDFNRHLIATAVASHHMLLSGKCNEISAAETSKPVMIYTRIQSIIAIVLRTALTRMLTTTTTSLICLVIAMYCTRHLL
jgi:hypothetical protein